MTYQGFNKDYNIVLPPPSHKVVLPPPSQIWDYRLANQIQLNYNTNGQPQQQQQQQQQLQHQQQQQLQQLQQQQLQQLQQLQLQAQMQMQMPQMNYITSPSLTHTGTTNTSPSPSSTPLSEAGHLSYPHVSMMGAMPTRTTMTSPHEPMTTRSAGKRALSTGSAATTASSTKIKAKPRKKKQCPECHLFFSNLSTHKSIHLNPSSRPFLCDVCGRGFSRSNDLFRHNKRHWRETGLDQGAFRCPFNTALLAKTNPELASQLQQQSQDPPCHPTGVFSRCDTYKNHLKALHFEYPSGTKKKMRNLVGGECKHCGKYFNSVNEWLDLHVETGECGWDFNDHSDHEH